MQLIVAEAGDTLSIETSKPRSAFNLFSGIRELNLTVYIPKKIYESVQVDVDNGSLQANQLQAANVKATARNGTIRLDHVNADMVRVESNNGNIFLDHVTGDLVGETNNGRIIMSTDDLEQNIDFYTNNGIIEIQSLKEPTNAILDIRAENGKIQVFGQSDWASVIGDGEHLIKLRANNGKITIKK